MNGGGWCPQVCLPPWSSAPLQGSARVTNTPPITRSNIHAPDKL